MSEAPKVIWAVFDDEQEIQCWTDPDEGGTKYHHDDTVTALQARVAWLEAALREFPHHKKLSDHIRERTKALEETR